MQYFAYSQKAFVYKYVVMMSDTDQFKHMSFANYLKLMFLATDALFVTCFQESFLLRNRLKLLKSKMQFKRQTVAGDNILIKLNSCEHNVSQFSLLYTFVMEGSGDLVGLGHQTYELFDLAGGLPKNLPDEMVGILGPIGVNEHHLLYKY